MISKPKMKVLISKKMAAVAALAISMFAASQASAAPISLTNGDFETGSLAGWNTIGSVFATGSTSVTTFDSTVWTIGAAGTTMAQLDSNGASIASIESTLGLASGTLNTYNTNPSNGALTNGSALYQTFSGSVGDSLALAWDYVARDYIPFNDPALALLIGPNLTVDVLASIQGLGIPVGTSGHSGWQNFSHTLTQSGTYTIAFVTTNDKDTILDSALFIDSTFGTCNPTCPPPTGVPEPATLSLIGFGLVGLGLARRRKV